MRVSFVWTGQDGSDMLDDDLASTQRVTYAFLKRMAALTCDCALETVVILEKGKHRALGAFQVTFWGDGHPFTCLCHN